ncbi:hypothetical protein CTKZ_23770 [Cellulomonas algicola]|uniref:Uncharacterized protein n=1 Tax=Cellulomonas algicola TaxID=2071633 RepID=A0A401V1N0_9CELL|nr:hypothetical protein CTKZ_23770 [Cellulomonas algicola]
MVPSGVCHAWNIGTRPATCAFERTSTSPAGPNRATALVEVRAAGCPDESCSSQALPSSRRPGSFSEPCERRSEVVAVVRTT